jgi:hypothetical protein
VRISDSTGLVALVRLLAAEGWEPPPIGGDVQELHGKPLYLFRRAR